MEEGQCISGTTNLAPVESQFDFYKLIGVTTNGEMLVTSAQMCILIDGLAVHTAEIKKLNCLLTDSIIRVTKTKKSSKCDGCW